MDWCRGRIFIKDLLAFPRVWSELKEHPDVAFIYNARNRFINPPPPGVRDWSIEFAVFVNGKVPLGAKHTKIGRFGGAKRTEIGRQRKEQRKGTRQSVGSSLPKLGAPQAMAASRFEYRNLLHTLT